MTDFITQEMIDAALERDREERARHSAMQAPKVSSDDMAQAIRIGEKRGLPPLAVVDDLPYQRELEELDAVEAAARANPGFGSWLQKPENVALAKDDLPALSAVAEGGFYKAPEPTYLQELLSQAKGAYTRADNYVKTFVFDPLFGNKVDPGVAKALGYASAEDYAASESAAYFADKNRKAQGQERLSEATAAEQQEIASADGWWDSAKAIATNPRALGLTITTSMAQQVPVLAASAGASVAATPYAGAAVAGAGSFSIEFGNTMSAAMIEAGVDDTDSTAVRQFLSDPDAMSKARERATKRGIPIAAFDALTMGLAGKLLLGSTGSVASTAARSAGEIGMQGTGGALGELSAQVLSGEEINPASIITEFVAEIPTGAVEVPANYYSVKKTLQAENDRILNISRHLYDKDYLSNIIQASQASKLFKQSPAKFEEMLTNQVGETMVYVPAADLEPLFQSERVDPAARVEELTGDANAWAEAAASGGAVAIPLAKYITNFGEQHGNVGKNARVNADLVFEERASKELQMPTRAEVQETYEQILAEGMKNDVRDNGPSGRVYDDFYGQLIGRVDDKTARQNAAVMQSLYRNLAERIGTDAYALSQRFQINIGSPKKPAAGRSRGVDSAIDPLIDSALTGKNFSDADIYGGSLVPAIVALGGVNPDSVGGGDLRSQDAAMRPGLLNFTGMTVERMAQTLADRGFNAFTTTDEAGRPDYRELVDLITQELGGNKVYSKIADNEKDSTRIARREAFRRDADLVASNFRKWERDNKRPVSELSREEQRAIAQQSFAEESNSSEVLDQSSTDQTETPEFKAWFGDSKVVDAEGNPLIVYHGTQENFDVFQSPAYFTEHTGEASAYTEAGSLNRRERSLAKPKYRIAKGAENYAGQRVPYAGIISDAGKRGDVVASDQGVALRNEDGTVTAFDDLVPDDSTFDSASMTVVLRKGDGKKRARELLADERDFLDKSYPADAGVGGNVVPVFLSIRNPKEMSALEANRFGTRLGGLSEDWDAVVADLTSQGFDGIVTFSDDPGFGMNGEEQPRQWIPFRQDQVKSATGNSGAFDANDPNILFQSENAAPVFYSQLINTIEAGKPTKSSGEQWLGFLKNQPGIKQEELDFYDLPAWLDGQKSVTKEQLLDYLRSNELLLEETTLGGKKQVTPADLRFTVVESSPIADGSTSFVIMDNVANRSVGTYDDSDAAEEAAYDRNILTLRPGDFLPQLPPGIFLRRLSQEHVDELGLDDSDVGAWGVFDGDEPLAGAGHGSYAEAVNYAINDAETAMGADQAEAIGFSSVAAPYANMVMPGGENYRVLLMKMPVAQSEKPGPALVWGDGAENEIVAQLPNGGYARIVSDPDFPDFGLALYVADEDGENSTEHGEFETLAMAKQAAQKLAAPDVPGARPVYTSNHFSDGKGVVAHIRFDERTDTDGKKVLFVQELQSDWHQAAYQARSKEVERVAKNLHLEQQGDLPYGQREAWTDAVKDRMMRSPEVQSRVPKDFGYKQNNGRPSLPMGSVPDAPFKTTWPELVIKRMLRYAVDNGFDRLAFPNEDMVPQIEQWGRTLAEIKANENYSKRFGAILERYSTEIPRIMKAQAKKLGGGIVKSDIGFKKGESGELVGPPVLSPMSQSDSEILPNTPDFPDGSSPLIGNTTISVNSVNYPAEVVVHGEGIHIFASDENGTAYDFYRQWRPADWHSMNLAPDASTGANGLAQYYLGGPGGLWDQFSDDPDIRIRSGKVETVPDLLTAIEITPEMRDKVSAGLPLFQKQGDKGPRGQVTGRGGKSIVGQKPDRAGVREFNIQLLEGADTSTFLHETAHAFLEIMADLAGDKDAPQQIRDDWAKAMAWLGVSDRSQIGRDQHEKWARGWEAYYREGKAPSSALRRAFASFKVWLTALYKTALSLNVNLTDDVRGVFDRLLASDAEIAEAQTLVYHEALLSDALSVGMSESEYEAYERAVQAAKAEAEASVAAEVLQAEKRSQLAWWRAERKLVRIQVEEELRALPVYRAVRWLRQGLMPDGTPAPMAVKLSKAALLDERGPAFLKRFTGLYSATGGITPNEAASLMGYSSGGELLDAIVNAPKLQEVIESDTARIMAERYPDPLTDGSLPDRAMDAVHSDKQADVMLREIKALERHTGERRATTAHVIAEVARRMMAAKRTRDIVPNLYRQAEAKAGREAFEAAASGDWPVALAARRRQLLNLRLFQEAQRVRAEVESIGKYLKGFTKTSRRAKLGKAGFDYLEQIDGILERFDFRQMSGPASDRRARLRDWIEEKRKQLIDVDLPPKLLDDAFRMPFKELNVSDLRMIRDSVKHLAHLADTKNSLLLNGERRDREAIDAAMSGSVLDNNKLIADVPGEPSKGAEWAKAASWARATTGAATDMARRLDGYSNLGPVWMNTVGVIRDAINNRVNPALQKAQETVATIYRKHYTSKDLLNFATTGKVEGVPGVWTKARILSLALNWGNEGNRTAVLSQNKQRLTAVEVGTLLGTLDARDWAFVTDTWEYVDSFWPEIAESQRRRKGLVPEKVEASPFTVITAGGETINLKGGYYPLKYEPDTASKLREVTDEFFESIRTGKFGKASTKDGHTIERTSSGGATVQLELEVLDGHLRNVIRDIHLGDAVNYVHNVMKGPGFLEAVGNTGNLEIIRGMDLWLRDVATGDLGLTDQAQRVARAFRTNFVASVLTFKAVNAFMQLTGVLQTSVVLGKGYTLQGIARYLRYNPKTMTNYVTGVSPFMASRAQSHIEAVQDLINARAGRYEAAKSAMIRTGYRPIGFFQQIVDTMTWLGAEAKGMADFEGDVKKARAYADDIVTRSQGSGEFMDKIALQRGTAGESMRQSEWIKAFTALQGYMITKHNAAIERTLTAKKGIDGISMKSMKVGMDWSFDMVNLFLTEAVLVAVMKGVLPGEDDDKDGDGMTDEWLTFLGMEGMANLLGGLPGLGSLVTQARGFDGTGVVQGMWKSVVDSFEQNAQIIEGDEDTGDFDKAWVKAHTRMLGYFTGIPASQINKTVDAIAAKQDGEDVSVLEYVRGPDK